MKLEWDELSEERFYAEYWRKQPVLIRGGARRILDFEVGVPFFRSVCDRLERVADHLVIRESGFIFAQNMDEAEPKFRRVSSQFEESWTNRRVWFDGVYATDGHTIGCHYDHSDNFVLQQSGTKLWKLASPDMLPDDEICDRMLEARNVGHVHMPDESHDFIVEPGDVLYIPLFWAHWGVSRGTSMSVSLVMNADAPVDVLDKPLREVLSHSPAWVQPLPALPRPHPDTPIPGAVQARIDALVDVLEDPSKRETFSRAFWKHAFVDTPTARKTDTVVEGPYSPNRGRMDARAFGIDVDRLSRLASADPAEPSPSSLVDVSSETTIFDAFARRRVQDLIDVIEHALGAFEASELCSEVVELVSRVSSWDDDAILSWVRQPEVAAWMWRTAEAIEFGYGPRFEQITEGFVESVGDGSSGIAVCAPDHWLVRNYPGGRRFGGHRVDLDVEATESLRRTLPGALAQLGQWPELESEVRAFVPRLAPLQGEGSVSIAPFVGLALVGRAALPMYLALETGRTKARVIARSLGLFEEDERRLVCPLDGSEKSASRLFADLMGVRYSAAWAARSESDLSIEATRGAPGWDALLQADLEDDARGLLDAMKEPLG